MALKKKAYNSLRDGDYYAPMFFQPHILSLDGNFSIHAQQPDT